MGFLMFMNTPRGRAIRGAVGVAVLGLALSLGGVAGVLLALLGAALVATAVLGVCPINPLVGRPMRACAMPAARRSHR
ncbi:MAG: DUF2892 domain-containing protein [Acidimicrobiales bacterium]|nr:DUF2892 domain-containing protein [Acidimicrobiales bacterium]